MWVLLVVLVLQLVSSSNAFSLFPKSNTNNRDKSKPMVQVMPLATEDKPTNNKGEQQQQQQPLLNWNASGSIGSLLIHMQKKEEAMRKLNKTLLDKEQAVDLSSHNASSSSVLVDEEEEEEVSSSARRMDYETAKELDDAVTVRLSSSVGKDVQLLELPALYRVLQQEEPPTQVDDSVDFLPPLSKPDHYEERIGRDMRHLAVSIASGIDDAAEWRVFCQQLQPTGGLMPLIECIREGAKSIREQQQPQQPHDDDDGVGVGVPMSPDQYYEESFLAASSACRSLRDLCALSLDLAAVLTDGLLRANAAYEGSLMNDLCTLLKYADDNTELAPNTRRRGLQTLLRRRTKNSSKWPRRNRKGKVELLYG
jgi:hypothetical protein